MRVGFFGGAFNPVHYGHLLLAEQCREQCALTEVRFVPTGRPAHRETSALAAGRHRARMLELATASQPAFRVDRRELEAARVSYTVDSLEALRRETPGVELFLLLTDDWLAAFHTWRRPSRIAELATLVVVRRAVPQEHAPPLSDGQLPPGVRERLISVDMPAMGHAGTDLRRRVADGLSLRYLTPEPVVRYVHEHGLYLPGDAVSPSRAGEDTDR